MKKISEKIIIDNGYRKIKETFYNVGDEKVRSFLSFGNSKHPDAVIIMALSGDKKILLQSEFRHGPEKCILSFPAGAMESNETSEQCAIRELREETGYFGKNILTLGKVIKNYNAFGFFHLILIRDVGYVGGMIHEDTEIIDPVKLLSITEIEELIGEGKIECPYTLSAYLIAKTKTNNFTT